MILLGLSLWVVLLLEREKDKNLLQDKNLGLVKKAFFFSCTEASPSDNIHSDLQSTYEMSEMRPNKFHFTQKYSKTPRYSKAYTTSNFIQGNSQTKLIIWL